LDADATRLLVTRAEGWAAGLRLAALTVRDAPDPRARALAVRGDDRHLFDFFAAEVLDPLSPDQRDLLVSCSVLDRLSGPLCDAVLGRTGSAGVLADLERAGVFVTALDPHRTWFRCHPLFRDVLRRRLLAAAPDAERRLLACAADWFLADGEVEEAVRHRLAAGDQQEAAGLLSARAPWFMERGLAGVYFQLGGMLAPAVARADPRLCVQLAYAAATSGHDDRVRWWLDSAGPLDAGGPSPRPGWRTIAGAAGAIRATVERAWTGGIEGALADAVRAVELENDPAERGYALVRFAWGRVLLGAGRAEEAAEVLTAVRRLPTLAQTTPVVQMQLAGATALALLRTGRHDEARRVCAEAAAVAATMERSLGDAAGPALTLLRTAEGQLAHLDGDIPAARALLARAAELARVWGHESSLVAALTAQAQAELAAGGRSAARALLNEAHDVAENGPVLPAAAEALRVAEARVGRAAVEQARHGQGLLIEELTDREQSILRALPGPLSQREIGAELYISMNTVKGYTKSLYRKLGVTGRAEAVRRAREIGLI
jgi:LuxR family maltose regulon positive regulatory protein